MRGRVVERIGDELLGGEGEEVGKLDSLDVDPDRVEEHRAADALVLTHRHLGGDPAADRRADDQHVAQIPLLEQLEVAQRDVIDPVEPFRTRLCLRSPDARVR